MESRNSSTDLKNNLVENAETALRTGRQLFHWIGSGGLLSGLKVRLFQNVTVAELDAMEALMRKEGILVDVLRRKTRSPQWREESFRNFFHARLPQVYRYENRHLERIGERLMEEAVTFLESHQSG